MAVPDARGNHVVRGIAAHRLSPAHTHHVDARHDADGAAARGVYATDIGAHAPHACPAFAGHRPLPRRIWPLLSAILSPQRPGVGLQHAVAATHLAHTDDAKRPSRGRLAQERPQGQCDGAAQGQVDRRRCHTDHPSHGQRPRRRGSRGTGGAQEGVLRDQRAHPWPSGAQRRCACGSHHEWQFAGAGRRPKAVSRLHCDQPAGSRGMGRGGSNGRRLDTRGEA